MSVKHIVSTICALLIGAAFILPSHVRAQPQLRPFPKFIEADKTTSVLGGLSFGDTQSVTLRAKGYTLEPVYSDKRQYDLLRKKWAKWKVNRDQKPLGFLTVVEEAVYKSAYDSDYYYLVRYEPEVDQKTPFALELTLSGVQHPFRERHTEYPKEIAFDKSVWQKEKTVTGALPKYTTLVENGQYGLWMSLSNVYKPLARATLEERYEKVQPIFYRQDSPNNQINTTQSGIFSISFPQKKGLIGEQWSVVSTKQLIDWNHSLAPTNLRLADLNRARKWSIPGLYYQVSPLYNPYTKTNFWRVPANAVGEQFIRIGGGRLFESFGLVSLYNTMETQTTTGYWLSTPRSTWLYKDYGIDAGFYDTRFNTDAGLFLARGYNKYRDQTLLTSANRYAQFLVSFALSHNFPTKNGGMLVYDYGHEKKPNVKTHSSLNHHITEMNFLYEMYLITGNKDYLSVGDKMKKGVKDTLGSWHKPNGDLHYARLINGQYGMADYPTLTLNDLKYSQRLIQSLTGSPDPDFQKLIDWKTSYLKKNKIPY